MSVSTNFNFRDITNGGANRFFTKNGQFAVAGSDVAGREFFDDVNDWIVRAADLYDGVVVHRGEVLTGEGRDVRAFQIRIEDDRVVLGGGDVQGRFVFQFDSNRDAINFAGEGETRGFLTEVANRVI